jgi:hypothetical protein
MSIFYFVFISGLLVSQITDEMAGELLVDTAAVLDSQRNLGTLLMSHSNECEHDYCEE